MPEATPPPFTIRVPGAFARLWDIARADDDTSLTAARRDLAAAWAAAPERRAGRGVVRVLTLSPALAAEFAAEVKDLVDIETGRNGVTGERSVDAPDDAAGRAGWALLKRLAALGIEPCFDPGYTLADSAAQAALSADIERARERDRLRAAEAAEAAAAEAARMALAQEWAAGVERLLAGAGYPVHYFSVTSDRVLLTLVADGFEHGEERSVGALAFLEPLGVKGRARGARLSLRVPDPHAPAQDAREGRAAVGGVEAVAGVLEPSQGLSGGGVTRDGDAAPDSQRLRIAAEHDKRRKDAAAAYAETVTALVTGGMLLDEAAHLVDRLLGAVRRHDADRLEEVTRPTALSGWRAPVCDLLDAVDYLRDTHDAPPVQGQ